VVDPVETMLTPELVLQAYRSGYFPMADLPSGRIDWYSPDPRAIIPLESFNIPRSLQKFLRRNPFEIRADTSFRSVVERCSQRAETWISKEIISVYSELHEGGFAHSVEAWSENRLVGGLYGVALGSAFFGESMFSEASNASKATLVWLVNRLRERAYSLLDTQFMNNHLVQFGTIEVPRDEYLAMLRSALGREARFP
jgi:leucyl/phenylalanyl-tRNA---protein transferase